MMQLIQLIQSKHAEKLKSSVKFDRHDIVEVSMQERGRELPPGHQLLTEQIRKKLPKLYECEDQGLNAIAQVKFFTPDSDWTWYATEFDGEDIFFGLVSGFAVELGYFSLSELQSVHGPLGLPIERDLYYVPKTLKELMKKHREER